MTPEDKELLSAHVKEIARILSKNTPPSEIETFEGIETAVCRQVSEHVSPKIAFFCRRKNGYNQGENTDEKKLCWQDKNH